jgi:polyhydroxyalkanoate synthesis regulator phasin
VDLYGYTSMAVAALQVQATRIAEQDAELAAQRARVEALESRLAALEARGVER